jgi:hypothetical protein
VGVWANAAEVAHRNKIAFEVLFFTNLGINIITHSEEDDFFKSVEQVYFYKTCFINSTILTALVSLGIPRVNDVSHTLPDCKKPCYPILNILPIFVPMLAWSGRLPAPRAAISS